MLTTLKKYSMFQALFKRKKKHKYNGCETPNPEKQKLTKVSVLLMRVPMIMTSENALM